LVQWADSCQRRIEALGVAECLNHRHLDIVVLGAVKGAVAPVADIGFRCREERFDLGDALHRRRLDFGLGVVNLWQALNLLDIENRVTLHVVDLALGLLAVLGFFGAGNRVRVYDQ